MHNALVMHVIFTHKIGSDFDLQIFSTYNFLLLLTGIFSIWNSPGLSQEVILVSQGSLLHYSIVYCH